jgi:hypothetical protein
VSATQEAALFIGFDNIRYGYLNAYGSEPDPEDLMKMARVYGQVVVAAAYADFSEHPHSIGRAWKRPALRLRIFRNHILIGRLPRPRWRC